MAVKLAQMGCKVSVVDIDLTAAEETTKMITEEGFAAAAIKCDVTNIEDIVKAGQIARNTFGTVDILINNAGIVTGKKILDITERDLKKTFEVNAISHVFTVKEFLPEMLKQNKGHIVSISSVAGIIGVPGLSDYCGSKFAAFGIDESL